MADAVQIGQELNIPPEHVREAAAELLASKSRAELNGRRAIQRRNECIGVVLSLLATTVRLAPEMTIRTLLISVALDAAVLVVFGLRWWRAKRETWE